MKQCRNFKHLVAVFNDQNDPKSEISNRIHKFHDNLYHLYPLLKDRNIPRKVKSLKIHNHTEANSNLWP